MRTAGLVVVLLAARIATLAGHTLPSSVWLPFAYLWQDAIVAVAFAAIDLALRRRPWLSWAAYAVAVSYVIVNVPVMRVLSTPLTVAMLRATRGPLFDSFRYYATPANLAWIGALVSIAALAPLIGFPHATYAPHPTHAPYPTHATRFRSMNWRRASARQAHATHATYAAYAALVLVAAFGPTASARVETGGLDRNAWTALVATARPRIGRPGAVMDWRAPREDGASTRTASVDLSRLRGAAATRNIVMVSLESTAARYLGLYGAAPDVMPNLSALARTAVVFDNAYAVYPESIKGLFSILCSAYPAFDRAADAYADVRCPSLPAELSARGYRTALFHSGRFAYLGMEAVVRGRGYERLEDAGDIGGQHESSFGVDEPSTVARMLAWIDRLPPSDRFFVTYLPIAGHHPYESPGAAGTAARDDIGRYRAALRYGDDALGQLRDGLRARGLDDRTLWIVFGDHGEAFGQHEGNFGHTFQLYDENVRVPFLISAPGLLTAPVRTPHVVSLIDTAPTVLDLVGAPVPETYQGSSALGRDPRMALFFADYSLGLLGLRDGRMKFIYEIESGRTRLFDLSSDPGESVNLAGKDQEAERWYIQRLKSWIR